MSKSLKASLLFFGLCSLFLLTVIFYNSMATATGSHLEELIIKTKAGKEYSFHVEIADTPALIKEGLMYRKEMALDRGMLFELPQTMEVNFWMKDTFIPLDIIFIAPDGEIKKIHENAKPQSLEKINSEFPVNGVLEINAGQVKKLGILKGDKIFYPYFR